MAALFQLSIFAQSDWLPMIADWCGVAGLIVGIVSLFITYWTFSKVQDVKKSLESERHKRIFGGRLSEHYDKFIETKEFIFDTIKEDDIKIDSEKGRIFIELIVAVNKSCRHIKDYDENRIIYSDEIEKLITLTDKIKSHIHIVNGYPNLNTRKRELGDFQIFLEMVIQTIEGFYKNLELELSYGRKYKKNDSPVIKTHGNDARKENKMGTINGEKTNSSP